MLFFELTRYLEKVNVPLFRVISLQVHWLLSIHSESCLAPEPSKVAFVLIIETSRNPLSVLEKTLNPKVYPTIQPFYVLGAQQVSFRLVLYIKPLHKEKFNFFWARVLGSGARS